MMCTELSSQSDWGNVHAYVDNIVVKSKEKETLIDDLKETFGNLRVYKMILTRPSAFLVCQQASFWVFWFLTEALRLTRRRLRLLPPWQSRRVSMMFNVWQVVLSRFISRLGEKAIPLYQMMKKTHKFFWSDAANAAFEDLKKQLTEPPDPPDGPPYFAKKCFLPDC